MLEFKQKSVQLTFPINQGPQFWLTDFPQADGYPDAINLVLPTWVPKLLYIVHAHIRVEQPNTFGQIAASIDHGRHEYATGQPPYHQVGSDWSTNDNLVSLVVGAQEVVRDFWPPKFLNRETDSIWIQNDSNPNLFTLIVSYMVPVLDNEQPNDIGWSPTQVNPPPPPPPSGPWAVVAGPFTFDGLSSDWSGYTAAIMVDPSALTGTGNGTQMRVSFSGSATIARVSINGQQAVPDGTGNYVASGGLDRINGMLVKAYVTSGKLPTHTAGIPGIHASWKGGDDTGNGNYSGYTQSAAGNLALKQLEFS